MRIRILPPAVSAGILALLLTATAAIPTEPGVPSTLEELGERLFFDTSLSRDRTQSCATCHDPGRGFADPRGAASIGDDGHSIGDRNAPTASYAMFSPPFHQREDGMWVGGQFLDGRAATLEDQAGGPPLNPIEMALPDIDTAIARLSESPAYVAAFDALFGAGTLDDPQAGYDAMTRAIAAFERTEEFAPFDSRYDRYLRGEVEFTNEEELGRLLFFSEQFTNCNQCHQLGRSQMDPRETFTNYEFHNIGVPVNHDLRARNGMDAPDTGLLANPAVDDPAAAGRFRTPTLRNVAVTGPYMHNGVFQDLRSVILFYNIYNTNSDARLINPETGAPFGPPEVAENISIEELTHGPALDDQRIDALVAFLRTLTDQRYEHLLDEG